MHCNLWSDTFKVVSVLILRVPSFSYIIKWFTYAGFILNKWCCIVSYLPLTSITSNTSINVAFLKYSLNVLKSKFDGYVSSFHERFSPLSRVEKPCSSRRLYCRVSREVYSKSSPSFQLLLYDWFLVIYFLLHHHLWHNQREWQNLYIFSYAHTLVQYDYYYCYKILMSYVKFYVNCNFPVIFSNSHI